MSNELLAMLCVAGMLAVPVAGVLLAFVLSDALKARKGRVGEAQR